MLGDANTILNEQLPVVSRADSLLKEIWPLAGASEGISVEHAVQQSVRYQPWCWPERQVLFFADPHADADAFLASLSLSGAVELSQDATSFELTDLGRQALFVIGGDCLDKGPSNLELLKTLRYLMQSGADVKLLAGNHDVRLLVGLKALQQAKTPLNEHLFLRMVPKVIPFFAEIYQQYLADRPLPADIPDEAQCRRIMFPREGWETRFRAAAGTRLTDRGIAREVKRMLEKIDCFEDEAARFSMGLREIYAAALKSTHLFLDEQGEFYWFFQEMQLVHREGSFLFIHAGIDDSVLEVLAHSGVDGLNQIYLEKIEGDLFEFYFGPYANTLRTKYRDDEYQLSANGVDLAHQQGIHAIVHGHRNHHQGQCLNLRAGLLHVESDITMDRNSRRKEGLSGIGHGVTVIHPEGQVMGVSRDYPHVKLFEPDRYILQKG